MCGIFIAFTPNHCLQKKQTFIRALNSLSHRGPDNTGYFIDHNIFLGHCRLSILDTGSASNQPFAFENFRLVYNGEIFNYIELRNDLINKGYKFDTNSDTEVVIKAFHCYRYECFNMFNGMWALAIYDLSTKELVICRDRFGQKPLFTTKNQDGFFYSSEISAIHSISPSNPNYPAIESFIKEGDFDVRYNTFFNNIFEFPKAQYKITNLKLDIRTKRYWNYPQRLTNNKEDINNFHKLLDDSVSIRLRTDVGYSLLLSGGCDSTLIAAITREKIGSHLELSAFTYSSKDSFDEFAFANTAAKRLKIKLHKETQELSPQRYIASLNKLVKHLGRGHSSPAITSVNYLYRQSQKKGYKVILDGQGADELLAGYKLYYIHLLIDLIKAKSWEQISCLIKDFYKEGMLRVIMMIFRITLPSYMRKMLRTLYGYEGLFSKKTSKKLQPHFIKICSLKYKNENHINNYLHKQHSSGLANLLYYGDIIAMANSIENRSPFMDHRLVEFAFSRNYLLKVDKGIDKAVLRSHPLYKNFSDILDRKKNGFSSDIALATKKQMVSDLQTSCILNWPIFNKNKLRKFVSSPKALSPKFERLLFRLFQVHLWANIFTPKDEA